MQKIHTEGAASERGKALIQIAYQHIVERGMEGLRVRDVAEEAGINNATLHYYFPTKESLIQGVVEFLIGEFQTNYPTQADTNLTTPTALHALHREFEDIGYRLRQMPEMFIVLTELAVRARRDPAIARLLDGMENHWHRHLSGIVERGIREGTFRPDLNPNAVASTLMAQMKAVGYGAVGRTDPAQSDRLITDLLSQIDGWLCPRKD